MAFCKYCGEKIENNAKFCSSCGKAIEPNEKDTNQKTREEKMKKNKCPNCGEIMDAFEVKCPSCGFEIRDIDAAESIRNLSKITQEIENTRENANPIISMFTDGLVVGKTDSKIVSVIQNTPIPNTVEDIVEFMIIASSNINPAAYANLGVTSYGVASQGEKAKSRAWESKLNQAYNKAKLSFKDEEQFEQIQRIYDETHDKIRQAQKESKKAYSHIMRSSLFMLVLMFAFLIILAVVLSIRDEKMIDNGAICPSYSSREFKGMQYEDVTNILEKDGFTNIVTKGSKGTIMDGLDSGEVIKVTIDGTYCTKGSYEEPDAPVLIEYKK
jgi:DNA-directed RNA polymerase subunit RPC12/RpoP